MLSLPTKRRSCRCQLYVFLLLLALLGGCASTQRQQPQSHPFFLTEEGEKRTAARPGSTASLRPIPEGSPS